MICIWHANCFPDPVLRGQPCRSWIKDVWCLSSLLLHDCLERYRKVVGRDWCHMSFGITAEGMLTGYSQNPSQSLLHLRSRAVAWCLKRLEQAIQKFNNNNNNNNNNGIFICVFECTIVNLATYTQFTNTAWGWIIKKEKQKQKQKQNKTKAKKKKTFKIALSLGYPSSYFYNKRCNMLL